MANKIVIELDLEKGDVSGAIGEIERTLKKSGEKTAGIFAKEFDLGLTASFASVGKAIAKTTSLIGSLATAYLGFKSIDAAQVQEDAINNLNNALRTAGDFSKEASASFQVFASDLQNVTRFGDELILNQIALAKSFGATNEQAKQIVTAAADLSAAFGIDLESATRNVAKTLGGLAGELGETIPQLKSLTAEQLKAGQGISILAERFSGAANRDVQTYSGAVDQLSNSFGDLLESVGRIITNNPQFISLIKSTTGLINQLINQVDAFAKSFNLFEFITNNLIRFNEFFITYVVSPFELLINIANVAQGAINLFVARAISGLGNLGEAFSFFLDKYGIGQSLSQDLKTFEQTSEEVAREVQDNFKKAYDGVLDFPLSDTLSQKNEELRAFFAEQNIIAQEASAVNYQVLQNSNTVAQESLMTWKQAFVDAFSFAENKAMSLQDQIKSTNELMAKFAKDSATSLRDGLARGAGQAFAAFGKAIATGEDALGSFAKALFKSIADQAVALGTNFILTGTAMLFSPNPADNAKAPFLIKSGAALAAFGGFLGGLSGGGAGGAASGGTQGNTGIGEGNIPVTNEVASPDIEQERVQPGTNVQVVVQGSLVQQEELGEFITKTLNESFGKQGVTLTDARFA